MHLRACHSKSLLDTRAIIGLPNWPKFKAVTRELKLIKQLPKGELLFMRTTPTSTYDPYDLIATAWPINFWLIGANTLSLSLLLTTNASNLKPTIITTKLKPEAAIEEANKYLSASATLVIMHPCEAEALMRFIATMACNGLSSKADTLIDTAASLNFVSKESLSNNGFYKDCKTAPKLAIRAASMQRISATKVFCPTVFTIDGHKFTDLQCRVLSHSKGSDIILGLPALKKLELAIHPSLDSFSMVDCAIQCNRESRRIPCLIVGIDKMSQIIAKQARNKKDLVDAFLISLLFAEELVTVKSDFGEQFDQQLTHRITEFADIPEETQGLPPHRHHLDHIR